MVEVQAEYDREAMQKANDLSLSLSFNTSQLKMSIL